MSYLRFFAPENQELLQTTETVDTLLRLAEIPDIHPHDLTAVIGPDTERAIYPGLCASFILVDATGYYDDESWIVYVSQDVTHERWRYWVRDNRGDTWYVTSPSKVAEELEREMVESLNKWKAWRMTQTREAISSNHFSVDLQAQDAMDWLEVNHLDAYGNVLKGFPEWPYRVFDGSWLNTEAMGVDPEFSSWLIDAIEDTGYVVWEDGEPWAVNDD